MQLSLSRRGRKRAKTGDGREREKWREKSNYDVSAETMCSAYVFAMHADLQSEKHMELEKSLSGNQLRVSRGGPSIEEITLRKPANLKPARDGGFRDLRRKIH